MANSTHFGSLNIVKKMFGNKEILKEVCNGVVVYEKNTIKPYVTFSSTSSFTIEIANTTKNWNGSLYYSTDTQHWNTWNGTSTIHAADNGGTYYLYLRGENNNVITGTSNNNCRWILTGSNIKVAGNIENLLDYLTVGYGMHPTMANNCFRNLFYSQTSLTDIADLELPAMTLVNYCYAAMFRGCSNITNTVRLPATTLAQACYLQMFYECSNLEQLSALPATTLAQACYDEMYCRCTKIKISKTQTGEYQTPYRIPTSGTGTTAINATIGMILYTGGTYTGEGANAWSNNLPINTTYYTSNTVIS